MAERVVVFVDYENLRYGAHHAFGVGPSHFVPSQLGSLLVSRRRAISELSEVRVYRGMALQSYDRHMAAVDRRRVARWMRDPRVVAVTRPLRYQMINGRPTPKEKGIDVALAIDVIRHVTSGDRRPVILVSRDSDLAPAVEMFLNLSEGRVTLEVSTFQGLSRLRAWNTGRPWCHFLSREDFEAIRDDAADA